MNSIGCPYRYSVGRALGGERFSSSRGGRRQSGTQALTFALTAARIVAIVVLCIFIWPDVQWPVVSAFVALQVLSLSGLGDDSREDAR